MYFRQQSSCRRPSTMPGPEPVLAAFGNPLLDIIVEDESGDLVKQFKLDKNIAQEMDTIGSGLHDEVLKKSAISYVGGGCALNSVRVFQWLSGVENKCAFIGGLGEDDNGAVLDNLVKNDGVLTSFALHSDLPTGHCIALVDGDERTLCANLGAAAKFDTTDLWTEKNTDLLKKVKVIYVEGYFLSHSAETTMELATFARKNKITFVFNLCGEYVCQDITYVENVLKILPFVNFIFGNRSEFDVFMKTVEAKLKTFPEVIKNLHCLITSKVKESDYKDAKDTLDNTDNLIAIVTEGHKPVQCYSVGARLQTMEVEVDRVPQEMVKDTIGAGDSFIAGFIFAFLRGDSIRSCVETAIWTSGRMIQQVGVSLPQQSPDMPVFVKETKKSSPCSTIPISFNFSQESVKINT